MNWIILSQNVMQLSVLGDYDRVFGNGQTLVQSGRIEFFVRTADEFNFDLNNLNSKSS